MITTPNLGQNKKQVREGSEKCSAFGLGKEEVKTSETQDGREFQGLFLSSFSFWFDPLMDQVPNLRGQSTEHNLRENQERGSR